MVVDPIQTTQYEEGNEDKRLLPSKKISETQFNILKRCLHDPVHKRKVLHSAWLSLLFICMGLSFGQQGPTLLDLQIITNTDLETSSFFITGFFAGALVGSTLCAVINHRMNTNLFLLTCVLGLGMFSIVTPYCVNFVAMIFIRALVGTCFGLLETAAVAEQMRVWGKEGTGCMHFLYLCLSLGGILSPLYSEPFLAKKAVENSTSGNLAYYTDLSTADLETHVKTTDVHYAFIITGIVCFISGIPWFIIYLQDKCGTQNDVIYPDVAVTQRKLPRPILLFMICMICLMFVMYYCLLVGFVSFLATFVVKEYNEPESRGAHLSSVFFALIAASRFVLIFISHTLTAVQLLFMSCFLTILTVICFTISAMFSTVDVLTILTAVLGLSISPIVPSGFSWIESDLMKVTSRVSASVIVSNSVSSMITPTLMGYLIQNVCTMWFCYLLVVYAILMCFVFLILFVTSKFFINKLYIFEFETSVKGETNASVWKGNSEVQLR